MENKKVTVALVVLGLLVMPLSVYAQTIINWYSLATNNTSTQLDSSGIRMVGEGAITTSSIIYNKPINGIILSLAKNGNPTGNFTVGVWSNSTAPTSSNYLYKIGTMNSALLTTTPTFYTFTNETDTHIIGIGQSVGVFYAGGNDANGVVIRSCFFNPDGCIDGTDSAWLRYTTTGSNWNEEYNFDIAGTIFFSDGGTPVDPTDNGVCPNGTALECVGDRNTLNLISGAPEIGQAVDNLLVSLGIVNSTNSDIKTNGTGIILMLSTGALFSSVTISAIAVANNKFGANIQYTEIPKEYWLFLVVGVVALAFYLNWIPDIVFYGMVVGLVGLFSFGLYTKFKGNG